MPTIVPGMASCTLSILLDTPTVRPGGRLCGTVVARVSKACRVRRVTLVLRWSTRGEGDYAEGTAGPALVVAEATTWAPGRHRISFSVPAPEGPSSHSGRVVSVEWVLIARADIAWRLDPEAQVPFTLVDGMAHEPGQESPSPGEVWFRRGIISGDTLLGMFFFLLLFPIGSAMLLSSAGRLGTSSFLMGLLWCGLSLVALARGLRPSLLRWFLGTPRIGVEPSPARPGERVTVRVSLCPRMQMTLEASNILLTCEEVARRGTGKSGTRSRAVLFEHHVPLAPAGLRLEAKQARVLEEQVLVPPWAPSSLHVASNELRWRVKVDVELPFGTRWREQLILRVGGAPLVEAPPVEAPQEPGGKRRGRKGRRRDAGPRVRRD
jgi:hypothetical protein